MALLAPFALGFGPAGLVVSVAIGAVVVGLAISTVDDGRGALPVSAHGTFDRILACVSVAAALALSSTGDAPAATFLAALGLAQLLISSATRYSRAG